MNEVTYFFGAGASCQSMPLVNNFHLRFEFFRNYIGNVYRVKNDMLSDLDYFSNQIKSHLSFDTFFKKLFHQDRDEEITKYKGLLVLFFYLDICFYQKILDMMWNMQEN